MKTLFRNLLVLALFISLLPSLDAKEKRANDSSLKTSIDKLVAESAPDVHVGVEVVSLKTGKLLYQRIPQHLFVPCSALKMITGAAALHELGVDFRFETKLLTDGKIENKVLKGNLYLQGSGDPELAFEDLEELTFQLKLLDIQQIEGDLYADNTLFDGVSQGPGWMWDEGANYWNSPMDALTVGHSCTDVWVRPAEKAGRAPTVYLHPKTDYVKLSNTAVTTAEVNNLLVERRWLQKENVIEISGEVVSGSEPAHFKVPVEDPHMYTAHVFHSILTRAGLVLKGAIAAKGTPEGARVLATHESRPLSLIVETMMKSSDNLFADCLFKKVGQSRFGAPGTWQKGSKAIRDFLAVTVGLNVEKLVVLDGSGLSRYNLISPHHFTSFLTWMHGQFDCNSEFAAALPISGVNGTLKDRMTEEDLIGRIRAKTGTMTGLSSLCGYVTTKEGETLAFSILQNGFTGKESKYKTLIEDQICSLLVNLQKND